MSDAATPREARRDRVRAEQIASIYGAAPDGVISAIAGGAIMAGTLAAVGGAPWPAAIGWVLVLAGFGAGHLLLCRHYRRAPPARKDWRFWGTCIALFLLAEGLTWGWSTLWLPTPGRLDEQLFVLLVVSAVAAGAVSVYGGYPPAFNAFFLASIGPYVAVSAFAGEPFRLATAALGAVFIAAMLVLGRRANRSFVATLNLRFEAADLAEDLRRQKEVAEQATLAKSRFLAAASHDLRQPVHALGMFVGALSARVMDEEARRLVAQIDASLAALDALFGSLLDISKLDAGVVEARPLPFAISVLLERIHRDHAAEALSKGLRLVLRPSSAIVHADPILLERILRNLVSNAVRYTERGRIVLGCRRSERLRIEVWDTGRGIAADQLDRVFQEFYQIDNPERDRAKGLGLGLAIVKRLTQLMGLGLTLRSRPGEGTVFAITVPLARAPAAVASPLAAAAADASRHGLILVVDDEIAIQAAMRSLLASWGHEVIAAGSGAEMLERTAACRSCPDLIICDYRLRGDEDGIAVIERLRSEFNEDIPAVLISGDTAPDRLGEARGSGFPLLHKPVATATLRATVEAFLSVRPSTYHPGAGCDSRGVA